MHLFQRPPSTAWEQLPLPVLPGSSVWAWFKPAQSPLDVVVRIPDDVFQLAAGRLTLRHLLMAIQLPAESLQCWTVQGMTLESQQGANPLLDHPLPVPVAWLDPSITLRLAGAPGEVPAVAPFAAAASSGPLPRSEPASPQGQQMLAGMEADWLAILHLESQLGQLRKQLNTAQGRVQSMNRDLSPDERLAADSNDVKDWQDARRFLRDASGHLSRYIREHDVGVTSSAGQRNRFEEIYQTYVVPRRSCDSLPTMQHEFETYRKVVQSLVAKMQTALSNAGKDGEQRAQQVLSRIAAKARKARHNR
ncbi:hypothetical protein [Planctomicrobium piriforme]|uniref:Uncharacterized protein n=1 Tax=Planctomicrobium piriforme TaxID=1576369 RepID=A0A1I3C5H7_9PLAN|nr:hypothetical protein [Planctomicrobium piriforme]SFH69828.1 hypothetical protein SAMN05421753_102122 [Planctomicrobium piriforme]